MLFISIHARVRYNAKRYQLFLFTVSTKEGSAMDHPYSSYLTAQDYIILGSVLITSLLMGVYFAFFYKHKQNTTSMFLMGGQKLGILPVASSLAITQLSGPNITGLPTEIYMYGTQYWIFSIDQVLSNFVMVFVYYPVYRNLKLISIFEYLRKRFSHGVRLLGCALYLLRALLLVPVMVYVPALVLAQVSGLSLHVGIPVLSLVAIIYTTLGGMTAVVWIDVVNIIFILISLLSVAIIGTNRVGGITTVWEKNKQSGRIDFFNMELDPRIRHTFWNISIGKFFTLLSTYSSQQSLQQKLLSLPSTCKARLATFVFAFLLITLMGISMYIGLVMGAEFADCDPITAKIISRPDQILAYYVMLTTSHIPGLPGVFITSICSTAIGATAGSLNAVSAVIMMDFVKPFSKRQIPEKQAAYYTKVIVVICGIIVMASAFVVDKLGLILQMTSLLSGTTDGTILGVITLGILFPWANSTGALFASIISLCFLCWVSIGAQVSITEKLITYPTKPLSIASCDNSTLDAYHGYLNVTLEMDRSDPGEPFPLFTLSYTYYTLLGVVITVTFGLIISFMTRPNNAKNMDPNLFSPIIHKFLNIERESGTEMKLMESKITDFDGSENGGKEKSADKILDDNKNI